MPKLRFPEFSGEWEEKKLGDFANFKNGVNKDKGDFGKGFPFVNLMDVFGRDSVSKSNFGLVNVTKKELIENNLVKGDILFIRSSVKPSGVGLTAVITEDLEDTVYSGFLIRFREEQKTLDLNFKKYCFYTSKFRKALIRKSTTSANTNINQDSLKKLVIEVPSVSEQQKIAYFLSQVDRKIDLLETKQKLWETYKKGITQQIFSQKIRFKHENGEDYPDWEEKKLEELAIFTRGPFGGSLIKSIFVEQGYKVYEQKNAIQDSLDVGNYFINEEKYNEMIRFSVEKDDLLISCSGTIGKILIIPEIYPKGIINQALLKVTPKSEINNFFLKELLINSSKTQYLFGGRGAAIQNIVSVKELKSIKITLPLLSEQIEIVAFLSALDKKILGLNKELKINNEFKKGLLQQMFF